MVVSHTEEEDVLFRIISAREEYDFSGAVRGKYHARYLESTNVVVLDPDVAVGFKNAEAVNNALRALLRIARESGGLTTHSS